MKGVKTDPNNMEKNVLNIKLLSPYSKWFNLSTKNIEVCLL
jgi:hypothetical protein